MSHPEDYTGFTAPDHSGFFKFLMLCKLMLSQTNRAPALHSWVFIFASDSRFFISSTSLESCSSDFWSLT